MGADLTYTCLGPNQYRITLKFFRDCVGINPLSSYTLNYSSATCGVSSTITLSRVGGALDITPICPSQQSSCGGSGQYGTEQYTFEGTLNLPAGCGNDWVLGWTECCRNNAITTLSFPGNQNMYVPALLNNTLTPCNSSPVFNNPPTPIVCVNQPIFYNHGVTDPDGDSLRFSLTNCLQSSSASVGYGTGRSGTSPLATSSGITINPLTGELTFTPNAIQIGVICIRVEEFRNGTKIGEVTRDMQFNVINCSNTPPVATGMNGVANFDTVICVGTNLCFDSFVSDANSNNVNVSWNNGIPAGTFSVTGNGGTSPTATFCWQPTVADLGTNFFTMTVQDDACLVSGLNTYTFQIDVVGSPNTANAGPDVSICEGLSTNLSATSSGGTVYTWSPTTGLSNPNIFNPVASPTVTTVYTVTVQFPDGCILSDQVTVTVNPAPTVSISPGALSICPGTNAVLTANASTAIAYLWSTGATSSSITTTPTTTTDYWVRVTNSLGCTNTDTVTVSVNEPDTTACNVIYASPSGSGVGTQASPASLLSAISMAACNNTVIKMAIGTYTITSPITTIAGFVTLEGGFDPGNNWRKTSSAGATTIHRTNANPEGAAGQERLVAIYMNSATDFRFQDVTISTDNATGNQMSTYGIHLTNCSDYYFTRVQTAAGDGSAGVNGNQGLIGANGGNGAPGLDGDNDDEGDPGHGGSGGGGGGAVGGAGGAGGFDTNGGSCCQTGPGGGTGGNSGSFRAAAGGGGGGCGGEEDFSGGPGGQGGDVGGGGGGGGSPGDPGSAGGPGGNGGNGVNGVTGAGGSAGSHVAGYWVPGGTGGTGTDGQGGTGAGGGGGGGGQWCTFCDDGAGSGGGGGGGGGQGSTGGTGGNGGGSSYGVYLYNNGANAQFLQCSLGAGNAGAGGTGGPGGVAGVGGNPGAGSTYTSGEVGAGGNGGRGGNGGTGGSGGNGSAGQTFGLYFNSGTLPSALDVSFNLAAQPVIFLENIACTNTDIDYTGTSTSWNLGANSSPTSPTGTSVTTQYTAIGRKDIVNGSQTYSGFTNILLNDQVIPQAGTNAPLVSGVYRICEGSTVDFSSLNPGSNYTYSWDMGGGASPNTYSGTAFDVVNNVAFNTAGTYYITLRYTTDCCGLSEPDSIELVVDPQPVVAIAGSGSFCLGDSAGLNLTASGANNYAWGPSTGLTPDTGATVQAKPTATTTYTVTGTNAPGTCSDVSTVTVTVNDLVLTPSSTQANCGANGTASVTPTLGSGSYTYNWTGLGQSTQTATGLTAGTYTVIVTDAVNGCIDSIAVAVPAGTGMSTFISNTGPVTCNGGNDGTATVAVSGGSGNFSYTWSSGANAATATPLAAGTYTVTVADLTNPPCNSIATATVTQPADLAVAFEDTTSTTCLNTADGIASVNASGGNGPYTFAWNTTPVQTTDTAFNLMPGTYRVLVTDASGCVDSLDVVVAAANPCALPVEYLYFVALPHPGFILLDWETTSESGSRGFEVERSLDGVGFNKIGWLESRSNDGEGATYELEDHNVMPGTRYYYRLKQLDYDGNHSYTDIREARLPDSDALDVLEVYPHPVTGKVFVRMALPQSGTLRLDVVNTLGQTVGIQLKQELSEGVHVLSLDLSSLAPGAYFGRLRMDGLPPVTVKFLKVE